MSFTLNSGKDGASPKRPLFLVTIQAPDGDLCYLTSTTAYGGGGLTYSGNTYLPRISQNDIDAIVSNGPQGYTSIPAFKLTIADGDKFIWTNHCYPHGWRGSAITLTQVLYDAVAQQYSTDAKTWSFIGGNPQHDHKSGMTTVDAASGINFSRIKLPSVPVSTLCVWDFPVHFVDRQNGLIDKTNLSYPCGYSADVSGGVGNLIAKTTLGGSLTSGAATTTVASATGFPAVPFQATVGTEELLVTNVSGTTLTIKRGQWGTTAASHSSGDAFSVPFTTCELLRSSSDPSVGCMARLGCASDTSISTDGNLLRDIAGNRTGHFGGNTWLAPTQSSGRSYLSGQQTIGFNQQNSSLAGTHYNMVYGTQWVNSAVLAPAADPNSLRSECVICVAIAGEINISKVLINGVELPQKVSDTDNVDPLFCWRYIPGDGGAPFKGGRQGGINRDKIYNTSGTQSSDPHGSLPFIEVVVPAQLGSVSTVQALVTGPPTLSFDSGGAVAFVAPQISDGNAGPACNLVWALLDLMTWGNLPSTKFHADSWFFAAYRAGTLINYTAADGSTKQHCQFKASFALDGTKPEVLAATITALRNAGNLSVGELEDGLIHCYVRESLADQQSATIAGSNYNTAVSSVQADGTAANGYLAYLFDETVIDKDSFRVTTTPIESTPNTFAATFQDELNGYQIDSLKDIDPVAYAYSGNQEIQVPIPVMGAPNFDQLTRVGNVQIAETLYGNPRNDPGGTLYFEFTTNQRVLHLTGRIGFIVGLTWQSLGIGVSAPQLCRVVSLKPDRDGEKWQVKLSWHNDTWYTFAYQQNPSPFQNNPLTGVPDRPPYPWQPGSFTSLGRNTFNLGLDVTAYPAKLNIYGNTPVNVPPTTRAPLVPLQGSTASTGGFIAPGSYTVIISANGVIGPVSKAVTVIVPNGTSTNTITVSGVQWPAGAAASPDVFAGPDIMHMTEQTVWTSGSPDANGNPTSFTLTQVETQRFGLPDILFSKFEIQQTQIIHGGVWGDAVGSASAVFSSGHYTITLTFPSAAWTSGQWAGYTLSLYYRPGVTPQPIRDVLITASTATTVTFTSLSSTAIIAGDVVIMRAAAAHITSNTIGDDNFINSYAPAGLVVNGEAGNLVQIISGTGAWQPAKTIASNTSKILTINGTWDITPDSTSVYIIIAASFLPSYTSPMVCDGSTAPTLWGSFTVASGVAAQVSANSVLIQVATADATGNTAPMRFQPFRELYIPTQFAIATTSSGYVTVTPDGSNNVTIDLAAGLNQRLVLSGTGVTILAPIRTGGTVSNGDWFTLYLDQDSTGGRSAPAFTGGAGGFVSNTGAQVSIDGTSSTRTALTFTFHGTYWSLDSQNTGAALS